MKNDSEFKDFVTNLDIEKHKNIEPRDALFGGRTEGFRTCYKTSISEKIHYVDIRSLYPKVLRDSKFPAKHPCSTTMQYNPDTNTHGIFSEYVNTFHALKTAASGFPQGCVTLEEKNEYIKKMESGDKIKLDVDKIQKDPALKSVAKALTTNLWGRQAINLKRSQVEYFLEPDSFYKTLKSPKVSVDDIIITNRT